MVAPAHRRTDSKKTDRKIRPMTACEWRLVDHFNTLEEAKQAMSQLRLHGIEAELSLIDGLSVIARQSVDHAALAGSQADETPT